MITIYLKDQPVSKSKNLRGILDYARRFPVVSVYVQRYPETGGAAVQFAFDNGADAFADFNSYTIACNWINARRSWHLTRRENSAELSIWIQPDNPLAELDYYLFFVFESYGRAAAESFYDSHPAAFNEQGEFAGNEQQARDILFDLKEKFPYFVNVNPEDADYARHSYKIDIHLAPSYVVHADYEGEAFDILIDYWEKNEAENPGYFLTDSEVQQEDYLDEFLNGGNHGRYTSFRFEYIRIAEHTQPR